MTQKEFATTLGVNSSIISKTEKGDQPPSALLIREYARAFGVTADYLLFGTSAAGPVSLALRQTPIAAAEAAPARRRRTGERPI